MSSTWGKNIKISIFGESHGNGIGVVMDNVPAGYEIDLEEVQRNMSRRAPGNDKTATTRKEADIPKIMSGFLDNKTTGAPICAIIENTNTRSSDYNSVSLKVRPGHADYTGYLRYNASNDLRGGGHFSGRLTAPLVFAGSIMRQILELNGVYIGAHIHSIADVYDEPFDMDVCADQLVELNQMSFPLNDSDNESKMREVVENARLDQDSVGGIIEVCALGVDGGLGSPMFDGIENILASILFGIPAVKGVEFGSGFNGTKLRGSQNNDPFYIDEMGDIKTKTNNHGGILGGITTGMPIVARVAIKPTPSISQEQDTVDLATKENTKLNIVGRHDPCIVPRAVVVVESAVALGLADVVLY